MFPQKTFTNLLNNIFSSGKNRPAQKSHRITMSSVEHNFISTFLSNSVPNFLKLGMFRTKSNNFKIAIRIPPFRKSAKGMPSNTFEPCIPHGSRFITWDADEGT
jgi:hypothetical protein